MSDLLTLSVPGAGLRLDPRLGTLTSLWFEADGRRITPLHTAPWVDDPDVQSDETVPLVDRRLAGDFFCAPFGTTGGGVPHHGFTANSPWEVEEITQTGQGAVARLTLLRPVQGARVTKTLQLSAYDPLVYQTHVISGGDEGLTVAHHPMLRIAGRGWLSFSPKRLAITPEAPSVAGRNWLSYPARTTDLSLFPGANGPVDLHDYPSVTGHEDFITLIEAAGSSLGWTVLIREAEDDLVLILKDPAALPVTMLWYSNGGRLDAPWNGRHLRVLGIEDGCTAGAQGLLAARGQNSIRMAGVATVLPLAAGRVHTVRHVIGAVARPAGWVRVTGVRLEGASLRLTDGSGEVLVLPFKYGFFAR